MKTDVIIRFIAGLWLAYLGVELGKSLELREICYEAEKKGRGLIIYKDIHGEKHRAMIEAYK